MAHSHDQPAFDRAVHDWLHSRRKLHFVRIVVGLLLGPFLVLCKRRFDFDSMKADLDYVWAGLVVAFMAEVGALIWTVLYTPTVQRNEARTDLKVRDAELEAAGELLKGAEKARGEAGERLATFERLLLDEKARTARLEREAVLHRPAVAADSAAIQELQDLLDPTTRLLDVAGGITTAGGMKQWIHAATQLVKKTDPALTPESLPEGAQAIARCPSGITTRAKTDVFESLTPGNSGLWCFDTLARSEVVLREMLAFMKERVQTQTANQ